MLTNLLLLLTGIWTALSFIDAPNPAELRLQHAPTPIALAALAWLHHRRYLSHTGIYCLLAFLWLHIFGARWLYSMVPYDQWRLQLFGKSLSDAMGWERNHYDRSFTTHPVCFSLRR